MSTSVKWKTLVLVLSHMNENKVIIHDIRIGYMFLGYRHVFTILMEIFLYNF